VSGRNGGQFNHEAQKAVEAHGIDAVITYLEQALDLELLEATLEMIRKWIKVAPRAFKKEHEVLKAVRKWKPENLVTIVKQAVSLGPQAYQQVVDTADADLVFVA